MWISTIEGAYVNVSLVEVFEVAKWQADDPDHPDHDRHFIIASTSVGDGDKPYTIWQLAGPFDCPVDAHHRLGQLVDTIHNALYPDLPPGRPAKRKSPTTAPDGNPRTPPQG